MIKISNFNVYSVHVLHKYYCYRSIMVIAVRALLTWNAARLATIRGSAVPVTFPPPLGGRF